jgi:hypothetical protein
LAPPLHGDVLDLDVALIIICPTAAVGVAFQQDIDARVLAVFDLAPERRITLELGDFAGLDGFGHQPVGELGIDADQRAADADHLPRVFELAVGVAGRAQPDLGAGIVDRQHGSRIGAVRGDHAAAVEKLDVGQEPLVAFYERAGDERVGKPHGLNVGAGGAAFNGGAQRLISAVSILFTGS